MNSTDLCSRCNRRKLLFTPGYLRRWLKPECKHYKRALDSRLESDDVTNCSIFQDTSSNGNVKNTISKFWKTKVFCGKVWSFHHYFGGKMKKDTFYHTPEFVNSSSELNHAINHQGVGNTATGVSDILNISKSSKCQYAPSQAKFRAHYHSCSSGDVSASYCQLSKYGWYWGNISTHEAEKLLSSQDDNVYLIRNSNHSRHLLSISFRYQGRTHHSRLCHANGLFSLNNETYVSANRLSEHCASVSVAFMETPCFLSIPLNRFTTLNSLQLLCRFVIRQSVPVVDLPRLPLPSYLLKYVSTGMDYIPK